MSKYPNITVKLTESDGNAFAILGKVIRAMKIGGVNKEEIQIFNKEATSGNYNKLLQTCMAWVNIE